MASAVNIVLADAQATPVNHTFIPTGKTDNVMWFEDQSRPTPIGFWKISLEIKKPDSAPAGAASTATRVNRIVINLHEPILETLGTNDNGITPPPTVSYISRSKTEFILPERNSLQDRKDIRKMTQNLLADTQVISMVENLIAVW